MMTNREFWKSLERCCYCHKKDAYTMAGRSLCAECAEKERDKKREKYNSDPEQYRNRDKGYYNRKKENGLCVKCGKPLEIGNTRVRCMKCTRKQAQYDRNANNHNRSIEQNFPRGHNGICYICNTRPIVEGKSCCAECYLKLREGMLAARKKQDLKIHPWKKKRV